MKCIFYSKKKYTSFCVSNNEYILKSHFAVSFILFLIVFSSQLTFERIINKY